MTKSRVTSQGGDTTPMIAARLDTRQFALPVIAMLPNEGDGLVRPMVHGTCFCVGPGIFVTAGHVLAEVLELGVPAIACFSKGNEPVAVRTRRHEIVAGYDVGVMAAEAPAVCLLNWPAEPVDMLHDVSAIGFPYAIDHHEEIDAWKIAIRAFKGSIITRRRIWRLAAKPVGYEVDCSFHPGLSGAPLLNAKGQLPELQLLGMVLGEQKTHFGGREISFGEALDVLSLADVPSAIAGEYLFRTGVGGEPGPRTLGDLRTVVLARSGCEAEGARSVGP